MTSTAESFLPVSRTAEQLKKQWSISCACRIKSHLESELRLFRLRLDLGCVRYLEHQLMELSQQQLQENVGGTSADNNNKPFDQLWMDQCTFSDETVAARFASGVLQPFITKQVKFASSIAPRSHLNILLQQGVLPSTTLESLLFCDLQLSLQRDEEERTCDLIHEILTTTQISDFGFSKCSLTNVSVRQLDKSLRARQRAAARQGYEPQAPVPLRTLVLDRCHIGSNHTSIRLARALTLPRVTYKDGLYSLSSVSSVSSSPLEALTLCYRRTFRTRPFVRLLISVLHDHPNLKCLTLTAGHMIRHNEMGFAGIDFGMPQDLPRDDQEEDDEDDDEEALRDSRSLPELMQDLQRVFWNHVHLQSCSLDAPGLTLSHIVQRNYYLWRLSHFGSAAIVPSPLDPSMWPRLLELVGRTAVTIQKKPVPLATSATPVYYFLRHQVTALAMLKE